MWRGAAAVLEQFEKDPAVRVIVVTGAGGKAFVSGADISKFESERASEEAVAAYDAVTEGIYTKTLNLPICCDLRIASEHSRFAVPAAKLGLGYGYTRIRRLLAVVGPQFAKEIFFTARQFTPPEALAMGLVNRIVPDGEIEAFVASYAEQIGGNAPLTVTAVKRIITEAL